MGKNGNQVCLTENKVKENEMQKQIDSVSLQRKQHMQGKKKRLKMLYARRKHEINSCVNNNAMYASNDPYIIKLPISSGHNLLTFLDTGSQISTVKFNLAKQLLATGLYQTRRNDCTAVCANGQKLKMEFQILLNFFVNGKSFLHWCWVSKDVSYPGAILAGLDLIKHLKINMNPVSIYRPITIGGVNYPIIPLSKSPKTIKIVVNKISAQVPNVNKEKYSVKVIGKQRAKGSSICHLRCTVQLNDNNVVAEKGKTFLVNPCFKKDSGIRIPHAVVKNNEEFYVPCFNFNERLVEFPNTAIVASAELIDDSEIEERLDQAPDLNPDEFVEQLKKLKLDHLNKEQQEQLLKLLSKFEAAFSTAKAPLGKVTCLKAEIKTNPPDQVVYTPQYRIPHALRGELEKIIQDLLKQGVIEPCLSPYSNPVLLVKKKNGTWRFAQDCRNLNKILVDQIYPLPRIGEVLESLQGMEYFTSLDARSGFHQIEVAEEDTDKLAFRVHNGTYKFKRLVFGLKNSTYIFQKAIDIILREILGKSAMCYVDDIVIYSKSWLEHLNHLREALTLLVKGGLKLALNKSEFGKKKLLFLGFEVSGEGVRPNPEKVKDILKIPPPTCEKEIRQFVAAAGFFRTLIPKFAEITAPLTELLKKDVPFVWTNKENEAFVKLKQALTSDPITIHPNFEKTFFLHTDASLLSLGACLTQQGENGVMQPVSYFSRKFKGPELNYSTVEREALAIIAAIKNFHYYLFGRKFVVVTDHKPLCTIFKKTNTQNSRIARWSTFISQYDFEVVYKEGKSNVVPDLLSRIPSENESEKKTQCETSENKQNEIIEQGVSKADNKSICEVNTEIVLDSSESDSLVDNESVNNVNLSALVNKNRNESVQNRQSSLEFLLNKDGKTANQGHMNPLWKNFYTENIIKEQKEDVFCKKITSYLKREELVKAPRNCNLEDFCLDNEVLYFVPTSAMEDGMKIEMRVVVPEKLINDAMQLAHVGVTHAHFGYKKTLFKARSLFYIPNLPKHVKDVCMSCLECARRKAGITQTSTLGQFEPVQQPLDHVHMDLLGNLPVSRLGNRYILSIVDRYSHYVTLYALPNKETNTVAQFFVQFILKNSLPTKVTSDRGGEFVSAVMKRVCEIFGTEKINTTANHPDSNGLCETYNTSIMNVLTFLMEGDVTLWDTHLNYISSAINSSLCSRTNNTAFYLFHGREYRFPISGMLQQRRTFYDLDSNYAHEVQARVNRTYELVKQEMAKREVAVKQQYDKKAKTFEFAPGSLIMLKNSARTGQYPMPKMNPRFTGPYRIIQNIKNRNLLIRDVFGPQKSQYVHSNRCKPYKPTSDCFPKFEEEIQEASAGTGKSVLTDRENRDAELQRQENQMVQVAPNNMQSKFPSHNYNLRSRF